MWQVSARKIQRLSRSRSMTVAHGKSLKLLLPSFMLILATTALQGGGKLLSPQQKQLLRKLNSIKLVKVDFDEAKPIAVFKYLRERSKELDPDAKGINFVFRHMDKSTALVTLKLENIPMAAVIKYVCMAANLDY